MEWGRHSCPGVPGLKCLPTPERLLYPGPFIQLLPELLSFRAFVLTLPDSTPAYLLWACPDLPQACPGLPWTCPGLPWMGMYYHPNRRGPGEPGWGTPVLGTSVRLNSFLAKLVVSLSGLFQHLQMRSANYDLFKLLKNLCAMPELLPSASPQAAAVSLSSEIRLSANRMPRGPRKGRVGQAFLPVL